MAQEKPIEDIKSVLPENWRNNDIISPDGTSVGLTEEHGYNYLMKTINEIISGVNKINNYFEQIEANKLIRIEDVSPFKDAVSVGNLTNRTVLKTVDNDGIYMYNETKGLQRLATIEELNKNIAGISLSFEAVISPSTGAEVNKNFEVEYPDGFDSSNCMVIGISEMEPANGNRMISEHTTVQLGAKQMIQVNYQNTFSTSRTIEIDIILMKIPTNF